MLRRYDIGNNDLNVLGGLERIILVHLGDSMGLLLLRRRRECKAAAKGMRSKSKITPTTIAPIPAGVIDFDCLEPDHSERPPVTVSEEFSNSVVRLEVTHDAQTEDPDLRSSATLSTA